MSDARKGIKLSDKTRRKMSIFHKENPVRYWLGKKMSDDVRLKISRANKGHHRGGWKMSEESRKNIALGHMGKKAYNWIEDRTIQVEKHRLRGTKEWAEWRTSVFERDKYTCQECRKVGGRIEPHHIIPIRFNKDNLFSLDNGITLCRPCHQKTIWKESEFENKYFQIISAH